MTDAVTPDRMAVILRMGNVSAEFALFDRLRYLDRTTKLAYSEIGYISLTVQAYQLHEHRTDLQTGKPCSFTRWIRLAAPWGYSQAFAAMRDVEELKDIPAEHLAEIPQSNFPILRQLSTAVRVEPQVIEAAKSKTSKAFVEQIRKDYPEQHLETRKTLRFTVDESLAAKVEEAIAQAMERGATTRSEALEQICAEAMEQWTIEKAFEEALK
jgi:hypothetical protein